MGKTIIYEKLQDVIMGSFGKDSHGVNPEDVMERINSMAVEESTNADDINNDDINNDTNANNTNNANNANTNTKDDTVDDIVNDDTDTDTDINNNDDDDTVDDVIVISDTFKAHFGIEEFEENTIITYVENLEKERDTLLKDKEEMLINNFLKEKGITKDVYESLKGETLKEKEESYSKVSTLSGFKLNSNSGDISEKELKLYKAY